MNRRRGVRRRALAIVAIGALLGYALASTCDRGAIVPPSPPSQDTGE